MSDYAKAEHHIVTVRARHEAGFPSSALDSVECHCCAPEDASCRTYPDCECEAFAEDPNNPGHDLVGHPFESGRPCWVTDWFDAVPCGEATLYVGADVDEDTECGVPAVDQSGHIDVDFMDDHIEWNWAGHPSPLLTIPVGQEPLNFEGSSHEPA